MSWDNRFGCAATFRMTVLGFTGFVAGIVPWFCLVGYRFIIEVPTAAIYQERGFAYQMDPQALKRGVLIGKGDSNDAPAKSTAIVQEGPTRRLGPAHSLHEEIRNLGGGRF